MGRKRLDPSGMTEKLSIVMSKTEAAELDAECERLTALNLDGFGRRVTRSDVVRRWMNAGKQTLEQAEAETKKKR